MQTKLRLGMLALVSAVTTISACGGGGGGSSSGDSNSRSTSGPITAFGSVYVNGRRYATDNADVYIEDELADEFELRVGMMVTIEEDDNGDAATVSYDDNLEGIVSATDFANNSLDVMGQSVSITNETIFESDVATIADITDIQPGDIVEISGYSSGEGIISATRIEVQADDLASYLATHPEGIEVKGVVQNHSPSTSEFDLGSLRVNYADAVLSDFAAGIENDLYVEVKSVQDIVANVLIASEVEQEGDGTLEQEGDADDEYEFSGIIMAINGDTLTVNSQDVSLTIETEFDPGVRESLAVGDEVEVEGVFDEAGNLVALAVEREEDETNHVELKDTIASIISSDINIGTITLSDGRVVLINNDTIMHDTRDIGVVAETRFNLADLAGGDYVEIYATDNGDGTYTALRLEREDPIDIQTL